MAEYVTIREFAQGWTFFARKIMYDDFVMVVDGTFPCVDFACSGCDDWLHSDNQNRKVEKFKSKFFVHFPKFHGKDVTMKYVTLDHAKNNYGYYSDSYGCHEFFLQEKVFIDE